MAIKVSMHNWMRPEPIEHTIKRLARLGYDGLEISGEPQGFDVAEVRGAARRARARVLGRGDADDRRAATCSHEDPYVRRGSVEYVKDCLTFVSELGGRIVTVVPSTVGKIVPMALARRRVGAGPSRRSRSCQAHAESGRRADRRWSRSTASRPTS